jgi:hypothetical protein
VPFPALDERIFLGFSATVTVVESSLSFFSLNFSLYAGCGGNGGLGLAQQRKPGVECRQQLSSPAAQEVDKAA